MSIAVCIMLMLPTTWSEEGVPSQLKGPRDFNYHPYQAEQYLKEVDPTKKGPVMFPNDGPPPPKPPLVVTSRPLMESIVKSDLYPETNNSIPSSSQLNHVTFDPSESDYPLYDSNPQYSKFKPDIALFKPIDSSKPHFRLKPEYLKQIVLGQTKDYKPFVYPVALNPGYPDHHDARSGGGGFQDYEVQSQSPLPPIYKVIADHARLRAQELQLKQHKDAIAAINQEYRVKEPELPRRPHQHPHVQHQHRPDHHHYHRDDHRHNHLDDEYPPNYAFSYKVRDHLTGDDFSHSQHSSGSATNGEYRVRLPDGRMQIVSYTADEHGYKADVRYDDEDKMKGNTLETHDDYKFGGGDHDHSDYNHNAFIDHLKINGRNNNDYVNYKPRKVQSHTGHERPQTDYKDNSHDYNLVNSDYFGKSDYSETNNHNENQADYNNYRPKQVPTNTGHEGPQADYKDNSHDYNLVNSDYFGKSDYSDTKQSVPNRDYKPIVVSENYKPVKESKEDYNQYADVSNEYNTHDYSLEYDARNNNFDPYESKFSIYTPKPDTKQETSPSAVSSTNRPLYEELKKIFVTKNPYNLTGKNKNPVEISVPSTTPSSLLYDTTTEHVVIIGTKPLYTNIVSTVTPAPPLRYTTPNDLTNLTPSRYLVSTIAHLKNGEKPVLSGSFIDRINKYLSF